MQADSFYDEMKGQVNGDYTCSTGNRFLRGYSNTWTYPQCDSRYRGWRKWYTQINQLNVFNKYIRCWLPSRKAGRRFFGTPCSYRGTDRYIIGELNPADAGVPKSGCPPFSMVTSTGIYLLKMPLSWFICVLSLSSPVYREFASCG